MDLDADIMRGVRSTVQGIFHAGHESLGLGGRYKGLIANIFIGLFGI